MSSTEFARTTITRSGRFQFGDRIYNAQDIIKSLTPMVTSERLERLTGVIAQRTYNVAVIAENIYDRGNVSAVMRSAEAFGFIDFNIVEFKNKRFKAANRVSKGTEKWLDIHNYTDPKPCVERLKSNGFQVLVTHLEASQPLDCVDFGRPTAIVLGNEKDGVSHEMLELADARVIIPMYGFAQSFNISVAAALSFAHIHNDRKARLGRSGDLTADEQEVLLANYLLRSVENADRIFSES